MTYDELLSAEAAPGGTLLRALWLAKRGKWDAAHGLVDDAPGGMEARIHAHLHRVEGDLENATYWYREAGVPVETGALDAEWEMLARELTHVSAGAPR